LAAQFVKLVRQQYLNRMVHELSLHPQTDYCYRDRVERSWTEGL